MGGILLQCIRISNHYDVHLRYLTILFVNYISIKPKNTMKICFKEKTTQTLELVPLTIHLTE